MNQPKKKSHKNNRVRKTHKAKYNEAGHQLGKGLRELGKGVTGKQSASTTTRKVATSSLKLVSLTIQGLVMEAGNNLTASSSKPKRKKQNSKTRIDKSKRQSKVKKKQRFNPTPEQLAKAREKIKSPEHQKGVQRAKNEAQAKSRIYEQNKQARYAREREKREQEQEKFQQWAEREPQPYQEDYDDTGTKPFTCSYQSCGVTFEVSNGQLDWYRENGLDDPQSCYKCRHERYRLFQNTHTSGTCEECGMTVTIPSKTRYHQLRYTDTRDWAQHCSHSPEYHKAKMQAEHDKQLSTIRADGKLIEGIKLKKKFEDLQEKQLKIPDKDKFNKDSKAYFQVAQALSTNAYCKPVDGVTSQPDISWYRNNHRYDSKGNKKETVFNHIKKHYDGKDTSLKKEFRSIEDAINYAHSVASVDNPKQFVDFVDTVSGGNLVRIDTVRNIEIIYSNDTPRHVVTMFGHESSYKTLNRISAQISKN